MTIHIIKLSVGSQSVESLEEWQGLRLAQEGRLFHTTRMRPRRREDVLDGGSIYWVIKGMVQCRQKITDLEEFVDSDDVARCRIMLHRDLIPVRPIPRRAFQGWRYFQPEDVPPDLPKGSGAQDIPPSMRERLAELCLI